MIESINITVQLNYIPDKNPSVVCHAAAHHKNNKIPTEPQIHFFGKMADVLYQWSASSILLVDLVKMKIEFLIKCFCLFSLYSFWLYLAFIKYTTTLNSACAFVCVCVRYFQQLVMNKKKIDSPNQSAAICLFSTSIFVSTCNAKWH